LVIVVLSGLCLPDWFVWGAAAAVVVAAVFVGGRALSAECGIPVKWLLGPLTEVMVRLVCSGCWRAFSDDWLAG